MEAKSTEQSRGDSQVARKPPPQPSSALGKAGRRATEAPGLWAEAGRLQAGGEEGSPHGQSQHPLGASCIPACDSAVGGIYKPVAWLWF